MNKWYDDDPYEVDSASDGGTIKEYSITSTPNDFNIQTIFNLMDNGIIRIPPFQRHYVWDKNRASKLIESIILGLPIPQVFLYEKGKNDFLIIDGQQRLLSIYFFMKERFPTTEGRNQIREYMSGEDSISSSIISNDVYFSNFSLSLPSPIGYEQNKYDKLKYETLGDVKHTFDYMRTIRSVVIKQNEPEDDDSSMHEIFNRLNTGGQNLKPQEIRMSLYYSRFYKILFEINSFKGWRDILSQSTPDTNFKDIEILLRAFAMLYWHTSYKAPMTKFLNSFSKKCEGFSDEKNQYLKELFIAFLESCSLLSTKDFFSANNRFNISLFESVFVASCLPYFEMHELIRGKIDPKSLQNLKEDDEFQKATQSKLASRQSVSARMTRAKALITIS